MTVGPAARAGVNGRHAGDGIDVVLVTLAAGLLLTQTVHVAEHLVQFGYWVTHPTEPPFLTPVATIGRDALAPAARGAAAGGAELLHLLGNGLFLAGLGLLGAHLDRVGRPRPSALRGAVLVQCVHLAEHVLLTMTWYATGTALGVTTLFGSLGGAAASSLRVIAHLLLNLAPTTLAVVALRELWRGQRHVMGRA